MILSDHRNYIFEINFFSILSGAVNIQDAPQLMHRKVSIPKKGQILENTYPGRTLTPRTTARLKVPQTPSYLKRDNYWASMMSDDDSSSDGNKNYSNI